MSKACTQICATGTEARSHARARGARIHIPHTHRHAHTYRKRTDLPSINLRVNAPASPNKKQLGMEFFETSAKDKTQVEEVCVCVFM